MKKVIAIGIIVFFIGSITCITEEGATKNNKQYISTLGDFDEESTFYNGIYTCTKIQNNNNKQLQEINGDIYPFYGESDKSIYIVKVSSSDSFYLENFYYSHNWSIMTDKPITPTRFRYCFLTNKIDLEILKGYGIGGEIDLGHLRYFHFQLGKLKVTKDDRKLSNMNGSSWTDLLTYKNPVLIPPGTWYFVFVGTIFNLDQDEVLSDISVWMNFSGTNLDISSSNEGVVYGLWFGEFDASIIVSKYYEFETMIGGKKQFTIQDTFIYRFTLFRPKNQGFWNMKWITPSGTKKMFIRMIDGIRYGNEDNYQKCIFGIGESGEYKLSTSYLDSWTGGIKYARPIYFVGLDIKLS
jgi:hypothetical protein